VPELVGLVYEAVVDEGAWKVFLERLRDALGGCQAALFIQGLDGAPSRMLSLGDPEKDREYAEHYGAVNPWFTKGAHLIRPGNVVTSEWLAPEELRRSEFYGDWLKPQKMFHAINGFLFEGAGMAGNLSVATPWRRGGFSTDELRLFRELVPHVQRAVSLQGRLGAPAAGTSLGAWLDDAADAVFVVDRARRVTARNRAARELLARRLGVSVGVGDVLRADRADDDGLLRRAIGLATGGDRTATSVEGTSLALARGDGGRPLSVRVTPLRARVLAFEAPVGSALVTISRVDTAVVPKRRELERLYGFTPKEAELAARLAAGASLAEAASAMHVVFETARTHVAHLKEKTRTHKLSELVHLLLLGAPRGTEPR
jgi:DNA-binding CsgD family transcriptional regulator